jgi:glycyl-tRNA synthetase
MKLAHQIKADLLKTGIGRVMLEDSGNIGKAYRRHDEIGTPLCVTVDFESIEKQPATVTIRNRDTMAQERIAVADLPAYLKDFF